MARKTQALINTAALRHNLARVRELAPGSQVMAVIKANAYGHGMKIVSRALADADSFAVATVEEAQRLQQVGVAKPIVLLEGVTDADELAYCADAGHELIVHHAYQVDMLAQAQGIKPVRIWLKAETGMHRLGLPADQFAQAHQKLSASDQVQGPIGLMSHFARADEPEHPMTAEQISNYDQLVAGLEGPQTLANSAGILAWPGAHRDWVRAGIMLYGISPMDDRTGVELGLQSAMTLESRLVAINSVAAGESVGYGGTFIAPESMPVGVVAIGYGDGYPWHLPNGTPVHINGQQAELAGRVSMDMLTVDLRQIDNPQIGDRVVLWGEDLPVESIASLAGTRAYELVCGVTRRVRLLAH